jgi:hypothetical protein
MERLSTQQINSQHYKSVRSTEFGRLVTISLHTLREEIHQNNENNFILRKYSSILGMDVV